jgi:hypothetical protein
VNYDKTKREIQTVVDMPDRLIDLFIKFSIQNYGVLGQQKRTKYFDKLSELEIERLESIVKSHMFKKVE